MRTPRHLLTVTLLALSPLLLLTQCKTPGVIPGWGAGAKAIGGDSYGIESSSPWGAHPPVSHPPRAIRPSRQEDRQAPAPKTAPLLDGVVTQGPNGDRLETGS